MNIAVESCGHAIILNLKGELNEDCLQALDEVVNHNLEDKDVVDLVFNMENVPFVDGRALEYLMGLQSRLTERLGQVRLVKCDQNIRKILEITRLDATFEIYDQVSQAVKIVGT